METEEEETHNSVSGPEGARPFVAVAVNKGSNSKHAVSWALDQFLSQGETLILIHVRHRLFAIPTPVGHMPIEEVSEEAVALYRRELNARVNAMMRPYLRLCKTKKIQTEIRIQEDDDVGRAIVKEISNLGITHLVMGASSRGIFGRFKGLDTPAAVSQNAPTFCSIYVVSKGRLVSVRSATELTTDGQEDVNRTSNAAVLDVSHASVAERAMEQYHSYSQPELPRINPVPRRVASLSNERLPSLTERPTSLSRNQPESTTSHPSSLSGKSSSSKSLESNSEDAATPRSEGRESPPQSNSRLSSIREITPSQHRSVFEEEGGSSHETRSHPSSEFLHNLSETGSFLNEDYMEEHPNNRNYNEGYDTSIGNTSWNNRLEYSSTEFPQNQHDILMELQKLKLELKQTIGMYAQARQEAFMAKIQANELQLQRLQETQQLEEAKIREEMARKIAEEEKLRSEQVMREVERARQMGEVEAQQRLEAQVIAVSAIETKKKEETKASSSLAYRIYTFEEIQAATDNFSDSAKIGEGGYGAVYKGNLQHTIVAIKVLREQATQGIKQFRKELEILSQIRHPHLVLLLGACTERGCLVYEYMANGSLEDRLHCKRNTPPLPWYLRFRIAWEIASALNFLHSTKPKPVVHRDLKPGNILLDHNFVSKIGDVGLARLAPSSITTMMTDCKTTTVPAGTFCYIDPEYQRTGVFGPKSDLYAYGLILLQLITAKAPMALTDNVEIAIEDDEFIEVLDKSAGDWPYEETLELAKLGLKCAELRRRDRPDLEKDVLPQLHKMKEIAEAGNARFLEEAQYVPPTAFICPISKEVMENPHVAADGFTYEYQDIKTWLDRHNTSPMTNLPMPHKNLLPNLTLRSAIIEWKAKTRGASA